MLTAARAARPPAVVAAVFGMAAMAGMPGCATKEAPSGPTRPPPLVAVARVQARDVPVEVRAPVDLRPLVQADVGSKTLGYLDAVLVERGDRVRKGQLLALVRPSDLPDQLAAARGTLAQVKSSAALARTNFERARALAPQAVISQQELQQADSQLASANAAEQAAEAQISALAVRLGETRIVSPLTGVVSQRRLDPGVLVGPPGGGAIITVSRTDVLRVFITVNEHDIGLLGAGVGKDARVELDALPGRSFTGKVVRLAPELDSGTRTLDAEVQLPNPAGELRPGMYGRGAIVVDVHPLAAVLPATAVVFSDGRAYAFVLEGDAVRRRGLGVGVDGGNWLEVRSGVRAGEEVVVAGTESLADGMKVRASRGLDPFTADQTGTLRGFPDPPAKGSDGQSPSTPTADQTGTLRGFPDPPAKGSDGQSPSTPTRPTRSGAR
jgi:RND family efflux transporter MFP subunit